MRGFGLFVLVVATALLGYALLFFDTSVSSGYGKVHNVGLMADRQNLIIFGGVAAIIGTLMAIFGRSDPPSASQRFSKALSAGEMTVAKAMLDDKSVDANGSMEGSSCSWLRYGVQLESVPAVELLLRKGCDPLLSDGGGQVLEELRNRSLSPAEQAIKDLLEAAPAVDSVAPPPGHDRDPERAPSLVQQLGELSKLKAAGMLTDQEFDLAKQKLLAR